MTWFIGIVVILVLAWLWHLSMGSAPNEITSAEQARRHIQYLLEHGLDGAELRFQVRNDPSRQLVFTKYVVKQNDVGCRSTYCEIKGREQEFEGFLVGLMTYDIPHATGERNGQRCTKIDYHNDIGLGQRVAKILFERGFKLRLESDGVAYFKNVLISNNPRLTRVDFPHE